VSRLFRDAVLALTRRHAFARTLVNSGRLSVATVLRDSPLNTTDADTFAGAMVPGAAAADAPVARADGSTGWLLRECHVARFTALVFGQGEAAERSLQVLQTSDLALHVVRVEGGGADGQLATQRYDAQPGTVYLLRPDQHVCARWRQPTAANIRAAIARALAKA
jgi:3-(3-hydroxy-phenyl)propionate hydroxylase